jgi:hypothetical protein
VTAAKPADAADPFANDARVKEMRIAGHSPDAIAVKLGISREQVNEAVWRWMALTDDLPTMQRKTRARLIADLDALDAILRPIAEGEKDATGEWVRKPDPEAAKRLRAVEQRRQFLG